ncbi:hypothetical protein D9M73_258700 [compost metagenome]
MAASGCTRCGVTIISNSRSSRLIEELRKNAPRIGISPSPGNLSTCEVFCVLIRPLMTKLSPSAREMLVSVRRMVNAGTVVPPMVTALL